MASKLHMLDESFRKFEMDDLGCQMLLSCEAAQLETLDHPIYGNLTSKVHKLLRYAMRIDTYDVFENYKSLSTASKNSFNST